jgi:hypothetical protein
MHPRQLDSLGERLLRSGVAPRHVRRYLRELRDHYDDAVHAELQKGVSRAAAEDAAATRMGDPESLIESVLARPELLSTLARYPRVVFGAAPVLLWMLISVTALFILAEVAHSSELMWVLYGATVVVARVLPVVLALGLILIAHRQRLSLFWPIAGAAIVAIVAGTLEISYSHAQTAAESSLGISSSLLPFVFESEVLGPANAVTLAQGLARAAVMLLLAIAPYLFWGRRQTRR